MSMIIISLLFWTLPNPSCVLQLDGKDTGSKFSVIR